VTGRRWLLATLPWFAAAGAAAGAPRVHEVQPGQSLWQIAQMTVGDATLWPALYHANRDQIKDPSRVYPGQRLSIPTIDPTEREAVRSEAQTLTPE
jgi:nucleoid-associated protein YgaU